MHEQFTSPLQTGVKPGILYFKYKIFAHKATECHCGHHDKGNRGKICIFSIKNFNCHQNK